MRGERWEPSPGVRAYQSVVALVPIIGAIGVAKAAGVKINLKTSGQITASDRAKVDMAATAVQTQGPNALILNPDTGTQQNALECIRGWAFHMAKQERRDYAAAVYTQLTGRAPLDTPGVVSAQNGPVAGGPKSSGGVLDTLGTWVGQITQGPSANIGTAAGTAAGQQVKGTILLVGALLAVGLVVAVVLIKRR